MKHSYFSKSHLFLTYLIIGASTLLHAQNIPDETDKMLNQIEDKMKDAALAGENVKIINYYTEDVILNPSFQSAIKGRDALLKVYQDDVKKGLKYHSFSGTVEKRWQHENEIFERGSFGMSVSTNSSRKPKAYYGSYFQIWEVQSDGTYQISYVIWNLDFNPFE